MKTAALILTAFLAGGASALAAEPAAPTAAERAAAVDTLVRRMDHYVLQEHKPAVTARLRAEKARYVAMEDPHKFAQAVTADLLAVTRDKHLQVWVSNPPPATPAAVGGPPSGPEAQEASRGHGIAEVRRLSGNVGYLRLNSFSGAPKAADAIDAAMILLKDTDALVIDLRRNGGGGEAALKRLVAHFFPAPVELETIAWRECQPPPADRPDACVQRPRRMERRWSDTISAPAYAGRKPVHILVGGGTFSAAEAFAYQLQQEKRAAVVGAFTGGGANPSGMMDLGERFSVVMPLGVTTHPKTGTSWEGVGVRPDVPVAADAALLEAYRRTLMALPDGSDADLNRERRDALKEPESTLRREMAL